MNRRLKTNVYNGLVSEAALLYPLLPQIQAVLNGIGMNPGDVNLHGAGNVMWDSVVSVAEKEAKLAALADYILVQYPQRDVFLNLRQGLQDGTAFIAEIAYRDFLKLRATGAASTFLLYDMTDLAVVKSLKAQLRPLKLTGVISMFDMHQDVVGGQDKEKVWLDQLGGSDIVLLMLTQSFFGNEDNNCLELSFAGVEMRKRVVPVLISNCLWSRIAILEDIVPLPKNRQFVSQWDNRDEALMVIAEGVEAVANQIKGSNGSAGMQ